MKYQEIVKELKKVNEEIKSILLGTQDNYIKNETKLQELKNKRNELENMYYRYSISR